MLVHCVFFRLRDDLDEIDRQAFYEGLLSLRVIPATSNVLAGPRAETEERPVIRRDYDYGLTVLLDDVAAHDNYQVHPLHQEFVRRFSSFWESVEVFDFVNDRL